MTIERLVSLGYSEDAAKKVMDFLGERVTIDHKSYNKHKPTRPTPTNGET